MTTRILDDRLTFSWECVSDDGKHYHSKRKDDVSNCEGFQHRSFLLRNRAAA